MSQLDTIVREYQFSTMLSRSSSTLNVKRDNKHSVRNYFTQIIEDVASEFLPPLKRN